MAGFVHFSKRKGGIKRCLCDRIGPVSDFEFEHVDAPLPSCDCSGAWPETELLHTGKRVRHDGVFEDFAVTNGVAVDRQGGRYFVACRLA